MRFCPLVSGTLPHPVKLVIAGNHELSFDLPNSPVQWEEEFRQCGVTDPRELLTNCTYLEDQTAVVHGIKIHAAPWYVSLLDGEQISSNL